MEHEPKPELTLKQLNVEYVLVLNSLRTLCEVIETFLGSNKNEEFNRLDKIAFPDESDIPDYEDKTGIMKAIQDKEKVFSDIHKLALDLGIPEENISKEGLKGARKMINAEFQEFMSSDRKRPTKPN